jgi:hypothetical protein
LSALLTHGKSRKQWQTWKSVMLANDKKGITDAKRDALLTACQRELLTSLLFQSTINAIGPWV